MTDNNAYGDLACYGHPKIKTSNIDAGLGIYKETREEKRSKETQKERDVRSTDEANWSFFRIGSIWVITGYLMNKSHHLYAIAVLEPSFQTLATHNMVLIRDYS